MILWLSVGASWIPPTLVFPLLDLTWIFPALNEMEEVAHEEGVAAGLGQNEAPAHNQAVVPMEVDEEQAGDVGLGKKLPFDTPFFWGVNLFSVSLVLRGFLQLGCLVWNGDASTAYCSEEIYSVLKVYFAVLDLEKSILILKPYFCADCNKRLRRPERAWYVLMVVLMAFFNCSMWFLLCFFQAKITFSGVNLIYISDTH